MNPITKSDLEIISKAKAALEADSIAMRLSAIVGAPIDALVKLLPETAQNKISEAVNGSLTKATEWAFLTAGSRETPFLREDWMHKISVVVTGALGGVGGLPSTLIELPTSTMVMLRSIGCIAEQEGMNMADEKTRLGCVSVLAMGADAKKVQADELGYWVTRKAMAGLVTQALEWNGRGAAPALARFLTQTAARFGVVVSEKLAAQAAPLIGAITGAAINHVFLDHYQSVAHAHFSIERLCLIYGEKPVKEAYDRL
jgi:hypothetical protein